MKTKKRIIEGFLVPALIVLILALIITSKYSLYFSSNDDALLRDIASGAYTGKPEAHLIYIMYPLGLIFKGLYTAIKGLHWYELFMAGMHLLCWFLCIQRTGDCFEKISSKIKGWVVATLILMAVDCRFYVMHQYTVLAAVMVATAILWIVTRSLAAKVSGIKKSVNAAAVILLLSLSLWLRKEALFMGLPIVVLSIALLLWKEKFSNIREVLWPLCIWCLIALLSLGLDSLAYKSLQWKEFKSFNEARTELYDYFKFPEYESYSETYDLVGIGAFEYEVLAHYMNISLPDDVTADKLDVLSAKYDEIIKDWQQYYSVPKKILKDTALAILEDVNNPANIVMIVLLGTAFVVCFLFDKKNLLAVIFLYAYRLVFTAFFVYKGRFPERVSYGLYAMIICFLAGIIIKTFSEQFDKKWPDKNIFKALGIFVALSLCALILLSFNNISQKTSKAEASSASLNSIYDYCRSNGENIYYIDTYTVAAVTPGMFSDNSRPSNSIMPGAWTSHGPLEKERMEYVGISSFQADLIDGENTFFVVDDRLGCQWLADFYKEEGISVSVKEMDRIDTDGEISFLVIGLLRE